jgi:hypothetical protein
MREDFKKFLTIGGGLAFLMVLVFYSIYQGRNLLFGAHLSVAPITQSTDDSVLTVSGIAGRTKQLTINGRPAPLDASGTFSESVALLPGLNVITVASTDSFGKTKNQTLYTYHTPVSRTAANIPPQPQTTSSSSQPETIIN